jgi:putative DNA primase/helicase
MAKNIEAQAPAQVIETITAEPGSQIDLANKFAEQQARGRLRYVAEEKEWFHWDGKVWRRDELGRVHDLIKQYVGKISVGVAESDGARRAFASQRTIAGIELILRRCDGIAATVEQWDADPTILCTPGGIIDLTTGEGRKAVPGDYCRKITVVASAPPDTPLGEMFARVLDNVTSGDPALARYMQKVAGYCLYGVQREKAFFVVIGETDSGKSTFFKTQRLVMNEYATSTNVENFLEDPRHFRTSTNNLAEIRDVRLVVTSEPDPGATLSASWIKRLVGVDEVHLRLNYRQGHAGATTYKVVLHCNEIPRLGHGGDAALRGRLRILPGGKSIPEAEQIKDLDERLREEYPSILRWMIDGAALWAREGLGELPTAAVETTDDYYREEDPLIDWQAECVERDPSVFTSDDTLLKSLTDFNPQHGMSKDDLTKRLKAVRWVETDEKGKEHRRGYCHDRRQIDGVRTRGFHGIRLKTAAIAPAVKGFQPW